MSLLRIRVSNNDLHLLYEESLSLPLGHYEIAPNYLVVLRRRFIFLRRKRGCQRDGVTEAVRLRGVIQLVLSQVHTFTLYRGFVPWGLSGSTILVDDVDLHECSLLSSLQPEKRPPPRAPLCVLLLIRGRTITTLVRTA